MILNRVGTFVREGEEIDCGDWNDYCTVHENECGWTEEALNIEQDFHKTSNQSECCYWKIMTCTVL